MPDPVGPGAAGDLGLRLSKCGSGTEKGWARSPELAVAKKTSKTGLASLKPAGLFFCLFVYLVYFLK